MSFKVVMKYMVLVVLGSIISGNTLFASDSISFSGDETLWIQNNPVVTLAIDNTYPPLNYIDENKNLTGLSVDYVRYIAKKAGISVQFDDSVWSVAIKKALDHEVDGIVNADATEERKAYLNFTSPYATYPCGLVTLKKQSPWRTYRCWMVKPFA